ncbi:YbgC/FadM family acyl-CoA thioesterase, partial [Oleiphilus sp. HI0123]
DVGGVVFYANYLKYFERARTEFIRSLGFELRAGFEEGISYVVHSLDVRYLAPAKLDEILNVTASVSSLKRTYIEFEQFVEDSSGRRLVEGNVKVACVSLPDNKPRALPEGLKQALSSTGLQS